MSIEAMLWAKRSTTGSPGRKAVLLVLADYADEAGECFPGQARIAAETEMGERTVRRLLSQLEEIGMISRTERRREDGYRTSDRIRLNIDGPISPANPTGSDGPISPANHDSLTGQSRPISPANVAGQESTVGTARGTASFPPTPHGSQQALIPVPAAKTYARSGGHDVAFEAFWSAYPRKVGKLGTRKAWAKAIRLAPDSAIIAGAQRYADDPNRDPEYTAHPTTWLNRGGWDDEPLPVRSAGRTKVQTSVARIVGGSSAASSAADVFTHGLNRSSPTATRELHR